MSDGWFQAGRGELRKRLHPFSSTGKEVWGTWEIMMQNETTLSSLHVVFANIISCFNKTASKTDQHVPRTAEGTKGL